MYVVLRRARVYFTQREATIGEGLQNIGFITISRSVPTDYE